MTELTIRAKPLLSLLAGEEAHVVDHPARRAGRHAEEVVGVGLVEGVHADHEVVEVLDDLRAPIDPPRVGVHRDAAKPDLARVPEERFQVAAQERLASRERDEPRLLPHPVEDALGVLGPQLRPLLVGELQPVPVVAVAAAEVAAVGDEEPRHDRDLRLAPIDAVGDDVPEPADEEVPAERLDHDSVLPDRVAAQRKPPPRSTAEGASRPGIRRKAGRWRWSRSPRRSR
jgi:hypothetical protein